MQYEPECEWLRGTGREMCYPKFLQPEGTYVDLGCSHPTNKSLTSFVRDLGWTGIAVDGNSGYAHDWQQAGFFSHFACAVLSDQPRVRFVVYDNSFTSRISPSPETDHPEQRGINRVVETTATPLNELLEICGIGKIDLLTIDLEGHEYNVLKTLDFEKHQPAFIISEFNTEGVGIDPSVCNLLLRLGYEVIQMFESNLIFRRK